MRITIIGSGALACLFGARLSTVTPVCLLGSWKDGLAAIEREGIRVESAVGSVTAWVRPTNKDAIASPAEVVLVLVKSWQTERAAQQAQRVLSSDGLVITLQNGLGNYETLAAYVGEEHTALGVTSQAATLIRPAHIRHAGIGDTHLGFTQATRDRLSAVAQLFNSAGLPTRLTSALDKMVWAKLAANSSINPLTALLQIPNGELLARPDAEALMFAAAKETAAVAEAKGVKLPLDTAQRVRAIARATAENYSSMYQDISRGAPTEIEAINGAIVREAIALHVPVPLNNILAQLVRATRQPSTNSV